MIFKLALIIGFICIAACFLIVAIVKVGSDSDYLIESEDFSETFLQEINKKRFK